MEIKSTRKANKKAIFLALLAISAAIAASELALLGVSGALEKLKSAALGRLAEKTGISVNFSKVSPSILSRLEVENFSVSSVSSGGELIFVDSFGIEYDLPKLFSESRADGLKKISAKEIFINCDAKEISALAKILAKNSERREKTAEETERLRKFSLELFERLSVQKISLNFESDSGNAAAEISDAKISGEGETLRISAGVRLRAKTKGEKNAAFSADFSISGRSESDFSAANFEAKFDFLSAASATLRNFGVSADYSQGAIFAKTVENENPFALSARYDFAQKDFRADFSSEGLDLQNFFDTNSGKNGAPPISVSGKYGFHANFLQKTVFDYFAQGEIAATGQNSPVKVSFDVSGDEGMASAKDLRVALSNGNVVEGAELYASFLPEGAVLYCPQIALGAQVVSNVQAQIEKNEESGNFEFELAMNDFSRDDGEFAREIVVEGTVLRENLFVQMSVDFNQFFADSVIRASSFFAPKNSQGRLLAMAERAKPYVISESVYFSTSLAKSPLENLSILIPAGIVVSAESDSDNAVFSVSANASQAQISRMDVSLAGQDFSLSGDVAFAEGFSDVRADLQLALNSIFYGLSVNYIAGQSVSVYGDYGLYATYVFSDPELKTASLQMENFPARYGKFEGEIASEAYFSFPRNEPFEAVVSNLTLTANSVAAGSRPRLQIEGEARDSEFSWSMEFSDYSSKMAGGGLASWRGNLGAISQFFAQFSMQDVSGAEGISASFLASGDGGRLSKKSSINASLNFAGVRFAHFLSGQADENRLRGSLAVAGTFLDPEFSLDLSQANFALGKSAQASVSGRADFQAGLVAAENFDVSLVSKYLNQRVKNLSASIFPSDLTGVLSADYCGIFEGSDVLESPLKISFSARRRESAAANPLPIFKMFERISAKVNFEKFSGNFFEEKPATSVEFLAQDGKIRISGGYDDSIFALYDSQSGALAANFAKPFPVSFSASGAIAGQAVDVAIDDIAINLSPFSRIISFPFIRANAADVEGWAHIGGAISEPEFSGELFAADTSLAIPLYIGENLYSKRFYAFLDGNALKIEKAMFAGKNAPVSLDLMLLFDGWKFDSVSLRVATLNGKTVAARCELPWLSAEGEGECDISIFAQKTAVDISGKIRVSDAEGVLNPAGKPVPLHSAVAATANLQIELGSRVQAMFPSKSNPVIRGAVAPNTPMSVFVDTAAGEYEFAGDFDLRGGEIVYVNRNFMLKTGRISVNADQNYIDPLITVVAEIKERDSAGKPVTITLSALNQRFSELSPAFSANPAKTQSEINGILGRILISENLNGETQSQWNDIIAAAADYGAQRFVFRELETRLRNSFNLDLFSMRIPVVQNAMVQLLNRNSENTPVSFAKIFNDSTIYLGKYFGEKSDIYANLSLTMECESARQGDEGAADQINFVPALGLEFLLPWNLTAGLSISKGIDDEKLDFAKLPECASFSLAWKKSL